MKVTYHIPNLGSTQADIFIYQNYRDAFTDLGHEFVPLENSQPFAQTLAAQKPDLLITNTYDLHYKHIDLAALAQARKNGLFVLAYAQPILKTADAYDDYSLKGQNAKLDVIKSGQFADAYYSYEEPEGTKAFTEATGYPVHGIPLAANKKLHFPQTCMREIDISFVGNRLPRKVWVFNNILFPMKKDHRVEVYGSNWSSLDIWLNRVGRAARRFKLPLLSGVRGTRWITLEREREVYSSSKLCPNFHEDMQAMRGVDVNERTFKVPACGGFEISDNERAVRHYYSKDEVATIDTYVPEDERAKALDDPQRAARFARDLKEIMEYYLTHEAEREKMQKKATERTLREHTYHNRAQQIIDIVQKTVRSG